MHVRHFQFYHTTMIKRKNNEYLSHNNFDFGMEKSFVELRLEREGQSYLACRLDIAKRHHYGRKATTRSANNLILPFSNLNIASLFAMIATARPPAPPIKVIKNKYFRTLLTTRGTAKNSPNNKISEGIEQLR